MKKLIYLLILSGTVTAAATYNTTGESITIRASIDGLSDLAITPAGIYWVHQQAARPGSHEGPIGNPTYVTDRPTYINEFAWYPNWESADAFSLGVSSSLNYKYTAANGYLVTNTSSRGTVTLQQSPSNTNGNVMIVRFNDLYTPGDTWMTAVVTKMQRISDTAMTTGVSIVKQPQSQNVVVGEKMYLYVSCVGVGPISYQWKKNGAALIGATSSVYEVSKTDLSDSGSYAVVVANGDNSISSNVVTVQIFNLPSVFGLNSKQDLNIGSTLLLKPKVSGTGAIQYQWYKNGALIENANRSDYQIQSLTKDDEGLYQLVVTDAIGRTESNYTEIKVNESDFTNMSVRSIVGDGGEVLIVGFAVSGKAPKKVLIRGIGPGLARFGVDGVIADPILKVYRAGSTNILAWNDDWNNTAEMKLALQRTGAFQCDDYSKDSGFILELDPGLYTAQMTNSVGVKGIGLIEVYEIKN